ncbi:MAG: metal-sensing transcriptional repressor [Oscillospiraceae bacterium]|nr:metal-sensing transcriptional repressor [Oscillospiraceae bacterium]
MHVHEHGLAHSHTHTHDPDETKRILNRLSRVTGHIEAIKRMIADGRDCSEVLIQLAAVRSALNNTGILILQSHLNSCIVEAVKENDMAELEELNKAMERYFK